MPDLSGRTFVVTGASGNLGRAVAEGLARSGAGRVLLDRGDGVHRGDDRTLALGGVDHTDAAAIASALETAVRRFGQLDGLVATAGAYSGGPFLEQDWAVWDSMLTANLKTAIAGCQAILPHLVARGGRIVTVGSRLGVSAGRDAAAYAASKSAVLRLTESLADEFRDNGVTVNCVLPSVIDTPRNRAAMPKAETSRWVPAEDVANVILFLLSYEARSVSGASIPVYGRA
jgi:NAD(P)-dependent dehydrogenase (short-subunit alcohol dehydrogenase family)